MKKIIDRLFYFVMSIALSGLFLACSPDTGYNAKRLPTLIVADENFLQCIQQSNIPAAEIEHLDCSENSIANLDGIESLSQLKTLNLSSNQVEDLQPLVNLLELQQNEESASGKFKNPRLIEINLSNNQITNARKLQNYALFTNLILDGNPLVQLPAPRRLSVTRGDGRLVLRWQNMPGALSYRIYGSLEESLDDEIILASAIEDRRFIYASENGTPIYFRVSTLFPQGEGDKSVVVSATPMVPKTIPSTPEIIFVVAKNNSVYVDWFDQNDTVYQSMTYQKENGQIQRTENISPPYTLPGLEPDTQYTLSIIAGNTFGEATSNTINVRTTTPESGKPIVEKFSGSAKSNEITLNWAFSSVYSSIALYYDIDQPATEQSASLTNLLDQSFVHNGLTPDTRYHYLLVATDQAGNTLKQTLNFLTRLTLSEINFEDDNLSQCIKNSGYLYTKEVKRLTCNNSDIENLTGLEAIENLVYLDLSNNNIQDISAISGFRYLLDLNLQGNLLEDATVLAQLPQLQALQLQNNSIRDIAFITELNNLKGLGLSNNPIGNITPLSTLLTLEKLQLTRIFLTDLSELTPLSRLTHLTLANNRLTDITVLSNFPRLQYVDLSGNQISDFSVLQRLDNLHYANQTDNIPPIPTAQNSTPNANAGDDLSVTYLQSITLDGRSSYDTDGDELEYQWTLLSSPVGSEAKLLNAHLPQPLFTANLSGDYLIQLVVNDGISDSNADTAILTYSANQSPTAIAGNNQTLKVSELVILDGRASNDPEGAKLSYQWQLTNAPAGNTAVLINANTAQPEFTPIQRGDHTFSLIVNDGQLNSTPDTVILSYAPNRVPVANAGSDIVVENNLPVSLNGNNSTDLDGDILSFSWTIVSTPAGSNTSLTNANTETPNFLPDVKGDYFIRLVVNDGLINSVEDTVKVSFVYNRAPIANAGVDVTKTSSGSTNFDGRNSSDPDGDSITYRWSLFSAPPGLPATLSNTNAAQIILTPIERGDYTMQLLVNDGLLDSAPVTVTLFYYPNETPTDITLSNLSIAEASPNASVVGRLSVADDEGTHTFRFANPGADDAGGRFSLSGNELQVANSTLLDYETNTSHVITIEVEDQGGLTFSRNFTITLTDVNDVSPAISNAGSYNIDENSTMIVPLSITDVDTVNTTFNYVLSGVDATQFEILNNRLKFKDTAIPDFENPVDIAGNGATAGDNIYHVTLMANDGVNDSPLANFTITVSNILDTLAATNLNATETLIENSAVVFLTDIIITSPDTTPVTVNFLPSDVAAGSLFIPATTNVVIASDTPTGSWSVTGVSSNLNVALAAVSFAPSAAYTQAFSYAVTVSDGLRPSLSGNKSFIVTPIAEVITASRFTISPDTPVSTGTALSLEVLAMDSLNNPVSVSVSIDVSGANSTSPNIANPVLGTYNASYTANNAGEDTYTVRINGSPLLSTPIYSIYVPDITAPSLLSLNPADQDNRMAINQSFVLTFNEAIDPASVTAADFTLDLAGTAVAGSVSTVNNKVMFTPDNNLSFGANYQASYSGTITDIAGNTLQVSSAWSVSVMQAPQVISGETYPYLSSNSYTYHQDSSGNIFHLWNEDTGTDQSFFYRFFDATSQAWSAPANFLSDYNYGFQFADNNDGILVGYIRNRYVYTKYFDGTTFTAPIEHGEIHGSYTFKLASNDVGFALIKTTQQSDVVSKFYDATTDTWTNETILEGVVDRYSREVLIASDGIGYAVTWVEVDPTTTPATYNLIAKVYDGVSWGEDIDLSLADTVDPTRWMRLAGNNLGYVMLWLRNSRVNINFYDGVSNITTLDDPAAAADPSFSLLTAMPGEFVAAWYEQSNLVANVYSQGSWQGVSLVSTSTNGSRTKLVAGSNSYMLAFMDRVAGISRLFASIYDGASWNTKTTPIDSTNAGIFRMNLTAMGDRYGLVWDTWDPSSTNSVSKAYAAIFDGIWSDETQLGTRDITVKYFPDPQIFALNSGFSAYWLQNDTLGRTFHGKRYDVFAAFPEWTTHVDDYTPLQLRGAARKPKMASNNARDRVVVWSQTSSNQFEFAYYSLNTGTSWSIPVKLPDCSVTYRGLDIVSNGNTFMITCGARSGGFSLISYVLDGGVLGPKQGVFTSLQLYQTHDILSTSGANYAATATSFDGLKVSVFDNATGEWASEQILPNSNLQYRNLHPQIAGNTESFTVTWWQQQNATLAIYDIYASTYKASVWGMPVVINSTSYLNNYPSSRNSNIISVGSNYLLTWLMSNVYTSIYDNVTSLWSGENQININNSFSSNADSASNGIGFHTVWTSFGTVYSRMFDGSQWTTSDLSGINVRALFTQSNGSGYGVIGTKVDTALQTTDAIFWRYENNEWTSLLLLENKPEDIRDPHITTSGTSYNATWAQPDMNFTQDPSANRIWVSGDF